MMLEYNEEIIFYWVPNKFNSISRTWKNLERAL